MSDETRDVEKPLSAGMGRKRPRRRGMDAHLAEPLPAHRRLRVAGHARPDARARRVRRVLEAHALEGVPLTETPPPTTVSACRTRR